MIDDLIIDDDQRVSISVNIPLVYWSEFCAHANSYGFEGKDFLILSIIFDTLSSQNFKKLKFWKMSEMGLISDFNQFK